MRAAGFERFSAESGELFADSSSVATFGTEVVRTMVALGLGAVLLFMLLDVNYLDSEKAYLTLYDAAAGT